MAKAKTPCCIEGRLKAREDLLTIVAYIGPGQSNGPRSFDQELYDRTRPLAQDPKLASAGGPACRRTLYLIAPLPMRPSGRVPYDDSQVSGDARRRVRRGCVRYSIKPVTKVSPERFSTENGGKSKIDETQLSPASIPTSS